MTDGHVQNSITHTISNEGIVCSLAISEKIKHMKITYKITRHYRYMYQFEKKKYYKRKIQMDGRKR